MIIYKIVNNINGKIYIGKTTKTLHERIVGHMYANKYPMQKDLREYGIESFAISIIDNAESVKILNEKERYWIAFLNCMTPCGYNRTHGGDGGFGAKGNKNRLGKHLSEENKIKLIALHTGIPRSEATKLKMSIGQKGKPHQWSPEGKAKAQITQFKPLTGIPICNVCGVLLTSENWHPSFQNPKSQNRICKKCHGTRVKEWKENNRDRVNERRRFLKVQKKALAAGTFSTVVAPELELRY